MKRSILALVLAAGQAPASAAEWRSMDQLKDCAAGVCWQARDADGSVASGQGVGRRPGLKLAAASSDARRGIKEDVPAPGKDGGIREGSALSRGVSKAWGFVKKNWPGILGGVLGGILGTIFLGPFGGIIGGVIGSLAGHFIAGAFGGPTELQ